MVVPGQSAGSRRKALALRSMMATVWPCSTSPTPRPEPTRPQPTMTMCTRTMQHASPRDHNSPPGCAAAVRPDRAAGRSGVGAGWADGARAGPTPMIY